jgi:hypothetical protein
MRNGQAQKSLDDQKNNCPRRYASRIYVAGDHLRDCESGPSDYLQSAIYPVSIQG